MEPLLKMFSLTAQDAQMIPFGALFFVGLWLLLGRFVFKPFLALVEARERATSGAVDAAKEKIAQVIVLRTEIRKSGFSKSWRKLSNPTKGLLAGSSI